MSNEENLIQCGECEDRFPPEEICEDGLCKECHNDTLVQCKKCENHFEENEIGRNGLCESCNELDDTPTSEECDYCDNTATTNVCGVNLCDDCLENYHH